MGAIYLNYARRQPTSLAYHLVENVLGAPSTLLEWLEAQPSGYGAFTWPETGALIGHYLWNELSGLEAIVDHVHEDAYPSLFDLSGAAGVQFYGPLESIFPELSKGIDRSFKDIRSMQCHCYHRKMQPLLINKAYVSARLRERVLRAALADPSVRSLSAVLPSPSKDDLGPVIVLGLRVMN